MKARSLAIDPDPIAIAAALSGAPGRCVLHSSSPDRDSPFARYSYVTAEPDASSQSMDPSIRSVAPEIFGFVPEWIGVVPYEARRELERPSWRRNPDTRPDVPISSIQWLRFPAVVVIDHRHGHVMVVGRRAESVQALASRVIGGLRSGVGAASPPTLRVEDPEPKEHHVDRVRAAIELICAGDLYQVNLSRRLAVRFRSDAGTRLAVFRALVKTAPTPFAALLELGQECVLSTSPELLLDAQTQPDGAVGRLCTAPIKGTRPRGKHARADAALIDALEADPKERAELAMIVDVERNDLGKVCEAGSVRLIQPPSVSTHRTIHHRGAILVGHASRRQTRQSILEAMVPSGSVTGAPKVRAMEVISRLEPHRRGLYTGGIGYLSHDGSMRLSMAIRTLVMSGDEGEYLSGGGIVVDSQPEIELVETEWKARQLQALMTT